MSEYATGKEGEYSFTFSERYPENTGCEVGIVPDGIA